MPHSDPLFWTKKLIAPFFMPLSIGLILFFIGLLFLLFNKNGKAKFTLCVAFIWIVAISYSPFSNTIIEPLELKYQPLDNYENVRINYILLLGGDFDGKAYEAVKIYNRTYGAKIITSGYPGLNSEIPVATTNANALMKMGINQEDILVQTEPRNTIEEARHVKGIVGNEWFILVASAYHMPRAIEIFRNEGLNPIPAPTNYLTRQREFLSAPNGYELLKTERAFHEYLAQYWLKIKALFAVQPQK